MAINVIAHIQKLLIKAGYQSQQLFYDALALAQKVTGLASAQLLNTDFLLTGIQKQKLEKLVHELAVLHKPLQYILGSVPFGSLELFVQQPTLIPRPETEEWVHNLIIFLKDKNIKSILDIGTGTGCIALALANALPEAQIVGVDIAPEAVVLARKNQEHNNIQNSTFLLSNLFESITGVFDIIVSNPPYIAPKSYKTLSDTVKNWEDKNALVAKNNGLWILKKIITQARKHFTPPEGLLALELGYDQADTCYTFMHSCGYTDIQVKKDFANHHRVIMGRYSIE